MKKPNPLTVVLATLLTLCLVVGLAVGGWKLHWWMAEESTDLSARINQTTYQRQNALVEQIIDDVREASDPALPPAQRTAIVAQICDSASKLTGSIPLTGSTATFVAKECS